MTLGTGKWKDCEKNTGGTSINGIKEKARIKNEINHPTLNITVPFMLVESQITHSETREHTWSSQTHFWFSWPKRASVKHVALPLHLNLPVFTKCYIAKQDERGLLQNRSEGMRREELQNILSRGTGIPCSPGCDNLQLDMIFMSQYTSTHPHTPVSHILLPRIVLQVPSRFTKPSTKWFLYRFLKILLAK
jgi:hypothetical protein